MVKRYARPRSTIRHKVEPDASGAFLVTSGHSGNVYRVAIVPGPYPGTWQLRCHCQWKEHNTTPCSHEKAAEEFAKQSIALSKQKDP